MSGENKQRIPELDGWRVLLVFVVSWYHIWQQSWLTPSIGDYSLDFLVRSGYMPVDGTILLSGFLLFLPWAKALYEKKPLPTAKDFYRRRAIRILPCYYFFILLDLFVVVLPQHQYPTAGRMWTDLAAHFTFTFTFSRTTYLGSPLFGGLWTIAVETQFYLLFPLVAKAVSRKPAATLLGLAAVSAYYRGYCLWQLSEFQMVVNQLASFFDVYAIGIAASMCYVWLDAWRRRTAPRWFHAAAATVLFFAAMWAAAAISRLQAGAVGYAELQASQMMRRPYYVLALAVAMLSLPFVLRPLRFLFSNPLMRFLAGISMNYYMVHQVVAVQLKYHNIPFSEFENPNMVGLLEWQLPYTWLCFGLSVLIAAAMTYLVEKPAAFGLKRLFAAIDAHRVQKGAV